MRVKSLLSEAKQIETAVTLINLGARLQVLESETDLSYERLLRLYKEVAGKSPSKGQLPFSTDWFMTWQPNVHSSLFMNIYHFLDKTTELEEIDATLASLGARDSAKLNLSIVRGLEYYTGPVFEAELLLETTDDEGNKIRFGSVGGGAKASPAARQVERVAPSPRGARAPGCPFPATPSPTETKPGIIAPTDIAWDPLPQAGQCPILRRRPDG